MERPDPMRDVNLGASPTLRTFERQLHNAQVLARVNRHDDLKTQRVAGIKHDLRAGLRQAENNGVRILAEAFHRELWGIR